MNRREETDNSPHDVDNRQQNRNQVIPQKEDEQFVVSVADGGVQPNAIVVHARNDETAFGAVFAPVMQRHHSSAHSAQPNKVCLSPQRLPDHRCPAVLVMGRRSQNLRAGL